MRKPDEKRWSAAECIEHLNNGCKMYIPEIKKALENSKVTNQEFMRVLRDSFAPMKIGLPAPTPLMYFGAVLLGTAAELVLKSRKVISRVLSENDFQFRFSKIEEAIRSME